MQSWKALKLFSTPKCLVLGIKSSSNRINTGVSSYEIRSNFNEGQTSHVALPWAVCCVEYAVFRENPLIYIIIND